MGNVGQVGLGVVVEYHKVSEVVVASDDRVRPHRRFEETPCRRSMSCAVGQCLDTLAVRSGTMAVASFTNEEATSRRFR